MRSWIAAYLIVTLVVLGLATTTARAEPPTFSIHFLGTPDGWCELVVTTQKGGPLQRAVTGFFPNRVNENLRYFPADFQGEIVGVDLAGIHVVDEYAAQEAGGGYRTAEPTDPPEALLPLTRTFALDSRGRVTFFHAVIRARDTNDVLSHMVWGYPPETAMQEGGGR